MERRRAADPGGGQPDRRLTGTGQRSRSAGGPTAGRLRSVARPAAGRLHEDTGAGLISTFTGVTLFLALLFVAVHLLLALYLTSVVTAVTWDAARIAAGEKGDRAAAEAHARQLLGGYGDDVRLEWGASGDQLTLTVRLATPDLLWPALKGDLGVDEVARTVTVRVEEFDADR